MAKRNPAPEFGKWDSQVHYTEYFERAKKPDPRGADTRPVTPPANSSRIQASSRPQSRQDPTVVGHRTAHQEGQQAAKVHGQYPRRTDRTIGAEADIPRRMANNASHPHRETAPKGVASTRANYDVQSNSSRPRVNAGIRAGAGAVSNPPWERNNSAESGSTSTNSMNPLMLASERPHLRPLAEGERTPGHRAGVPKFGEWNVNSPSAEYGFTQTFGQLSDQKKTGISTTPVAAAAALPAPSFGNWKLDAHRRRKGRCWPSWCSFW